MTSFCWLIEAPGTRYLGARQCPIAYYEFHWTQDHNAALRFRTEQDADLTMMAIRQLAPKLFGFAETLGDARAIEHGWMREPSPVDFLRDEAAKFNSRAQDLCDDNDTAASYNQAKSDALRDAANAIERSEHIRVQLWESGVGR